MSKKNNTNRSREIKITIRQILDGNDDDSEFYRDILRYIIGKKKGNIENETGKKGNESKFEFRVWELCKWLLKNNRQLRDNFLGDRRKV